MEIYYPEVDIGSLTYWEIGEMNPQEISSSTTIYSDVYLRIFVEEISYLPHHHLWFWRTDQDCKYCSFGAICFKESWRHISLLVVNR
jgi:hypothetical protein